MARGSLRQALWTQNDGDTIDATGISGVITLTTGQLLVDKSVTINGPGADRPAIDGNAASVVFFIFRNLQVKWSPFLGSRSGMGVVVPSAAASKMRRL